MSKWTNQEKKEYMNYVTRLVLNSDKKSISFYQMNNDEQMVFIIQKVDDCKNDKVKPSFFAAKYKELLNEYYGTTDRGYINQLPFKI
jgi:hypothetical protein